MANPVLDAWRKKYPGAYDHVSDADLAEAITKRFPGAYDDKLQDVFENAPIVTGDPAVDEPGAATAAPATTPAGTRIPAVPAAQPPPFQVPGVQYQKPGFFETLHRGAKQIVQYGAGNPDYPTTGSETLDLLTTPLRWTMHGLGKNIETYTRGGGYGRPEDVTEMLAGAATLVPGSLGRSPGAFKAGRWAKPSPPPPPPGAPGFIGPPEVLGPPEPFGPPLPPQDYTRVGIVRKGDRGPAPTQTLLEAAKASTATPEVQVPNVPPGTRRMLEGQPRVSMPPAALAEPMRPPLPLPGTRTGETPVRPTRESPFEGPSPVVPEPKWVWPEGPGGGEPVLVQEPVPPRAPPVAGPEITPYGERGKPFRETRTYGPTVKPARPALQHDIPGERVNPQAQQATQSALQAARDLETGRQLDLGEAGRRAAAARGRYPQEPGSRLPRQRPPTETVVREPSPPPAIPGEPSGYPPPPGAPTPPRPPGEPSGYPPPGTPGAPGAPPPEAPPAAGPGVSAPPTVEGGAPPGRGQPLPDDPDALAALIQSRVDDMNAARKSRGWRERFRGARMELKPERMLTIFRSGEPGAKNYADVVTLADPRWNAHVEQGAKAAAPTLRKIRTPDDLVRLSTLEDSYVTPEQLAQQPPHVQAAYNFLEGQYAKLADQLGLPQSRRHADYYPHIFDTQEIRSALQTDLTRAIDAGDAVESLRLETMLNQMPQPSIGSKAKVPESVYAWMMQKRTGAPGYSWDPIDAYKAYLRKSADKLYAEPVYKAYFANAPTIKDPELLRLMARHAADFSGRGRTDIYDKADSLLRSGMYWTKLAGNVTWPAWNLLSGGSTSLSYFTMKGDPGAVLRGLKWAGTPEGRAVFGESGHTGVSGYHALSGARSQIESIGGRQWIPEPVKQAILLFPDRVERVLRSIPFFGQLSHELEGKLGKQAFREMLAKGIDNIPEPELIRAHRAVTETQASYGARHDPGWLTKPGFRAVAQFAGTGAKIIQGLSAKQGQGWYTRPILMLPLLTEVFEEGLKQANFDASRIAGIGVDVTGLVHDFHDYSTNPKTDKTIASVLNHRIVQQFKEGRSGLLSFGLGPIIPAVSERLPSAYHAAENWITGRPGAADEVLRATSPEVVAVNRALRAYRSAEYSNPLEAAGTFINQESERHRALRRMIEGAERGLPGMNAEMYDFITRGKNVLSADEKAAWKRALTEGQKLRQAKRQWEKTHGPSTPAQRRMEERPTSVRGAYEP